MKRISAVKLFVMILALVMSAPNVYAIKHTKKAKPRKLGIKVFPKGARQQPKARRPITPNQQGITRSPSNPVSKPDLERSVARAETSSKPEASRPLQHSPLATLERRFDYSFKEPITTRKTMTKEAQTEILEQVQQEISIRAQEFVTKQGRWMEGSTRGSKTPFQSEAAWNMYTVKGVTKEEMELANLATKIILYGDEKYPAVTQLIELYESFGHAGKKGLVEAMRNVIEFSKREDDLLRAGIYNPEFRTEGEKLLKEMTDRMPEHVYYGDDLVLKQCYKLIANMQERNSYRYHLNLLEDFIAQEGRLPQTHGWNGKEQTKAQYSAAQQEEYHLYATDKRLMSQYPAGESAFVDRIRLLWEQYGKE